MVATRSVRVDPQKEKTISQSGSIQTPTWSRPVGATFVGDGKKSH
jgi:hypothetical protein